MDAPDKAPNVQPCPLRTRHEACIAGHVRRGCTTPRARPRRYLGDVPGANSFNTAPVPTGACKRESPPTIPTDLLRSGMSYNAITSLGYSVTLPCDGNATLTPAGRRRDQDVHQRGSPAPRTASGVPRAVPHEKFHVQLEARVRHCTFVAPGGACSSAGVTNC